MDKYKLVDVLLSIHSGGTPSTKNSEYWNGNLKWLSSGETSQDFISDTLNHITNLGVKNSSTKLAHKGDVVIACAGQGKTRGQVSLLLCDMYINQSVIALTSNKNIIYPLYLYYNLKNRYNELRGGSDSSSIRGSITTSNLKNLSIYLPSLKVQKKSADVLYSIDTSIINNNKRIKLLEQMAENLYKEWFVRFRFPGYETTTFKSGIPSNWTIKKLKDFGRIETGKTPSTAKPENYGNAYHFVKTPDMHGNIFVIKTEEMLSEIGSNSQIKKLLPINSIMVSCIGSAGIVAINTKPAHTNQQINSIVLDKPYELEWLYFTCKELKGTIQSFGANGATMTNLSKGKFEKLKVYYPTPEIISKFHQMVEPMFSELKSLLTVNENLIKQRDLLLPRLMSGKLEVE